MVDDRLRRDTLFRPSGCSITGNLCRGEALISRWLSRGDCLMSCFAEIMPSPIVSPYDDRVVDHRLLLGVASSSDRSWLHCVSVTPLRSASMIEHSITMTHTMEGKYSRMREGVNDQRNQESSKHWERRPTTVARSPNHGRNRTELAGRG